MIPDHFVNTLLERIDIVDIIGSRLTLKKSGSNYSACCPFHNEKTPSFSVNQTKQFYHCFGCGLSGDAIEFLKQYENLSFVEAISTLAGHAGLEVPDTKLSLDDRNTEKKKHSELQEIYNVLDRAKDYYIKCFKHAGAKHAINYLKKRGLTGIIAKDFNIGFALPGWNNLSNQIEDKSQKELCVKAGLLGRREDGTYYDRFRFRIMFPILDKKGRTIAFGGRTLEKDLKGAKYLNSPETIVFNKSQELYGLYEARKNSRNLENIIVVEGYMDVVALSQYGVKNVVATLGTSPSKSHVLSLFKFVPEIIFCFDSDLAGKKAAWRALEISLPLLEENKRIKFLNLPKGYDPDLFIREHGKENFMQQIKRSYSLADFTFNRLSENLNLANIDDKVVLANKAKPIILKLPKGMLQDLMLDRLAKVVGVTKEILLGITISHEVRSDINKNNFSFKKSNSFSNNFKKEKIKPNQIPPVSPIKKLVALLILHRSLIEEINEEIMQNFKEFELNNLSAAKFLLLFLNILRENNNIELEELRQKLPVNFSSFLNQDELQAVASTIPKGGEKSELIGVITLIKSQLSEKSAEYLLQLSKQRNLTEQEKEKLQFLLIDLKNIKNSTEE